MQRGKTWGCYYYSCEAAGKKQGEERCKFYKQAAWGIGAAAGAIGELENVGEIMENEFFQEAVQEQEDEQGIGPQGELENGGVGRNGAGSSSGRGGRGPAVAVKQEPEA